MLRTMNLLQSPFSLRHLLLSLLVTPQLVVAGPHIPKSLRAGFSFNELFARYECGGELCGWNNQLCCTAGSACYTNAADQAECGTSTLVNGHWTLYTTTYVETDLQTVTATMSSYVGGGAAAPTPTCNYALNESPCGTICCSASQYCAKAGQCKDSEATSSDRYSTWVATRTPSPTSSPSPSPPVLPTSSSISTLTQTTSPTTTVPFETPVATGGNITITGDHHSSVALSGGDIAGIVIGVLIGVFLLGLLCFYCCLKGLLDGVLAIFGLGKKRKRTTEVEEYERRSHHDSRGNRRTWYGAPRPPPSRRSEKRDSHLGRDVVGIGAGLAAMWAILGLKRRSERKKNEERYSEYSDNRTYYSEYYTSASSASTDDRRTRVTRDTRRSVSRR